MKKGIVYLSIILAFLSSCMRDSFEQSPECLVIEGWIEAGSAPVIMVSRTLPISALEEKQSIDDLGDYVVKWAKVSVIEGTDTVVLFGKHDKSYKYKFVYTTGQMTGVPGKSYKLKVEYSGVTATAQTTIPLQGPQVESIVRTDVEGDTLYKVNVILNDNPDNHDYYGIFCNLAPIKDYYVSPTGILDDEIFAGEQNVSVPVYRTADVLHGEHSTLTFHQSDDASIRVSAMDSISYRLWFVLTKKIALDGILFMPSSENFPSNITGGLGYWTGFNSYTGKPL